MKRSFKYSLMAAAITQAVSFSVLAQEATDDATAETVANDVEKIE